MYPRRLLTAVFSLLLLQRTMAVMTEVRSAVIRPLAADNKTSSITSTSTLSTTTGTTEEVTSLENADILGCQWPEDFIERFEFCANKAAIDVGNTSSQTDLLRYGLLSRTIMDDLFSDCSRADLTKCVKKVDPSKLDEFLLRLSSDLSKYSHFEDCLQINTEAMDRLCGANTEVSRVVSGTAGLHLNLISVLVQVKKEREEAVNADKNITDDCLRKVVEAVHITAAMHIQSEHYMDNSVLCWNVAHDECDDDCSALAAELNCLQSDCAAMSLDVLQELGIWQWYFMNTANARKVCAVEEGQCAVGQDALGGANTGIGTLFDGVLWRKKMRKMARDVESTFGVSIQVAVAISLAVLAAFCASCTALCAYRAGMCGDDRRVRRYSRLDEGERFEESSRALTKAVDIDGLDD